jgi:hypothetical protein
MITGARPIKVHQQRIIFPHLINMVTEILIILVIITKDLANATAIHSLPTTTVTMISSCTAYCRLQGLSFLALRRLLRAHILLQIGPEVIILFE